METQMLQTLTPCLSFQTLKHRPVSGHWGHGIAAGSRRGARVSLSLSLAGCWAVTGPGSVRGRPGGSVTVECGYEKGDEEKSKFWCREGTWRETWFCSDGHVVETTAGSEAEVTRGRFSIRDNRTRRVFTVTVKNLTLADAGTYQCGVDKSLQFDPRHTVSVSVSPDVSLRSPITDVPPQSPTIETPQITKQPDSPSPTTTESTFSASADTTPTRFTILILLLGLSKGLVFLGIVCAATWGSMRDRKSRREMVSRRTRS
ncbi:CMRF35-like molecule 9 isoform X2 [Pelodiscus sinensis]|uniref:CMRF35-like molecule 9 isoform X2 n=1 Tax=Pelodiscus sinensis TaxID=13735 RepID=UPI003F6D7DD9